MTFKVEISDIANMFLICKRMKRVPYYYRGHNYQKTESRASKAHLFKDKAEADKVCAEVNAKRKGGHLFRVEPAHKHYVNNWSMNLGWNRHLTIKNNLKPFDDVKNYGYKVNSSLESQKGSILHSLKSQIEAQVKDIQKKREDLKGWEDRAANEINNIQEIIRTLETTDLDELYVKPYTTSTDKSTKILFGKKEEISNEEMTTGTMMMLPVQPRPPGGI